jgi:dCMP deaminase
MKRKNYISWDEYFMGIALLSAKRSKDPNTQVGACIVNQFNKIVGIGYNGFPIGCSDDDLPWDRKSDNINDTKYPYVVHAEANAILNSTKDLHGARIYVALFPCNECTKLIIQSGIKEIVYLSDKYSDTDTVKASKKMLEMAGVKMTQLDMGGKVIELDFSVIN